MCTVIADCVLVHVQCNTEGSGGQVVSARSINPKGYGGLLSHPDYSGDHSTPTLAAQTPAAAAADAVATATTPRGLCGEFNLRVLWRHSAPAPESLPAVPGLPESGGSGG